MPTKGEKLVFTETTPIRLDRFLVDHLKGLSRAYVADLIDQGLVRVNGIKVRKAKTLSKGDTIEVDPFLRPEERRIQPNPDLPLKIVWESEEMLVVDKQPNLPTHPNDFQDKETLANILVARFPEISEVGEDPLRPGIVHRLDTNTSGLLLVAKTQEMFLYLRSQFDERKVKKTYQALVLGEVPEKGEIDTPLAHHPTNPRKMVAVTHELQKKGRFRSKVREAKTLYEPIETFDDYTLLEVRTLTGRMHQVRVHLASIGHPLAGDKLYQSQKERQQDHLNLDRHFLHAVKVILHQKGSKELNTYDSIPSDDLSNVLRKVREKS